MELVSLSPFPAELLLWEADAGQPSMTVVVKVTLRLVHDGEATVADTQIPIGGDEAWDEGPVASVFRPGDRAPLKPRTDIVLVGHAYAPTGAPVEKLVATMKVGDLSKSIAIHATRAWTSGPAGFVPGPPIAFDQMALRYERGALTQDNPVGIDPASPPVEGALVGPTLTAVAPATFPCFGPISASWRPRRRLLGEAGRFWALAFETGTGPGEPAPRALDFRFFNVAPPDQQTALLRQRAEIELVNLNPTHATLRTRLPALRPQVFHVGARGGRPVEVALRCDTLWIDCDQGIACLVWRGLTDVPSIAPHDIGTVFVVAESQGKRVRFEQVERAWREGVPIEATEPGAADALAVRHDAIRSRGDDSSASAAGSAGAPAEKDETRAIGPGGASTRREVMPFSGARTGAAAPPAVRPPAPVVPPPPPPRAARPAMPAIPAPPAVTKPVLPLPIAAAASAPDAPEEDLDWASTNPGSDEDTADRLPHAVASTTTVTGLPFLPSAPAPIARPAPVPTPARPAPPATVPQPPASPSRPATMPPPATASPPTTMPPPAIPAPPTPPPAIPAPANVPKPASVTATTDAAGPPPAPPRASPAAPHDPFLFVPAAPEPEPLGMPFVARPAMLAIPAAPPPAPGSKSAAAPVEPAHLGPLAGLPKPATPATPAPPAPPATAPTKSRPPPAMPAAPADPLPAGFEPKDVPVATYGAISAELMIRRGERARVLDEHKLSEPAWARVHAYWTGEMGRETARGESRLLAQFDSAYVETMGRLRKPIGVPEYAALLVAIERGGVDRQLAQLSLSLSDLMRVQRVWTRRLADEPEVGKILGKAIEEARAREP